MRVVLIIALFFCLVLPTASLALNISDIIKAIGRSSAEFQDNVKRLTGDTLEGRGMVLDVKKTWDPRIYDVHIVAGKEENVGVVVVIPVSSLDIPFQWKNEVRFSGRIKSITIKHHTPDQKYLLVILSDGDVHRTPY